MSARPYGKELILSTEGRLAARLGGVVLAAAAAAGLAACAGTSPSSDGATHFSDLHFSRQPHPGPRGAGSDHTPPPVAPLATANTAANAPTPALRARVTAPPLPAAVLPISLTEAERRVQAYLGRAGFALEMRPDDGGALVTATRMGPPGALDGQAVCGLEALRRPTIASTDLTVRLAPAPGGVELQASARFVEIDTKLLSGDLARQTCRSKGVLEAAVERAALGG